MFDRYMEDEWTDQQIVAEAKAREARDRANLGLPPLDQDASDPQNWNPLLTPKPVH